MSENTKGTQKGSWLKTLQREFKKIIWPDKNTLAKQTTAVVTISILLGVIISIVDTFWKTAIDLLVK